MRSIPVYYSFTLSHDKVKQQTVDLPHQRLSPGGFINIGMCSGTQYLVTQGFINIGMCSGPSPNILAFDCRVSNKSPSVYSKNSRR